MDDDLKVGEYQKEDDLSKGSRFTSKKQVIHLEKG
jgi:hypothetical protein